jgi:SAM-dependent methyltransferase
MIDFDAFTRFYDADMGSFDDDLPLYAELAHRTDGPILDAMCGTGRVILPLAEQGFDVVGLDLAPAMVEVAQQKAHALGVRDRVRVVHGDIRRFDLQQQFGLVAVPLNSFMHLETVDDQLAALGCLRQHLRRDGLLVLDVFNPLPQELASDQGVLVHERTFTLAECEVQKYVVRRTDWAEQQQAVEFIYDERAADGLLRRSVLPFTMRWVYRFELEHLLARAGLVPEAFYGDYSLTPYSSDGSQLIVVAHRA